MRGISQAEQLSNSFETIVLKQRMVLQLITDPCLCVPKDSRLLKKWFFKRLVKNIRMHGARNSEERGVLLPYVAMTKDERNTADGCFSTVC